MKRLAWLIAGVVALTPMAAYAYGGFITDDVDLRAGPDIGYPAVTPLPSGAPVDIQSCIDGWTWCDVIAGPNRGWVAGTYLQEDYSGQRVFVSDYGARIGIPIIAFSLGAYWGVHYHDRPWYRDRSSWEHRHFAYRAPPAPRSYRSAPHGPGRYEGHHDVGHHAASVPRPSYAHAPVRAPHATPVRPTSVRARPAQTRAMPHAAPARSAPRAAPARAVPHAAPTRTVRAAPRPAKPARAPAKASPAAHHDDDHHHR